MSGPLLQVEDLSVRFHTEDGLVHAVDDVSFDVDAGEVLAVVGESGCGKTVTALSMVGLLPPSARVSGHVRLHGEDLVQAPQARLRELRGKQVGFVFQEPMTSLNPVLTVGRQVGEVLRRHEDLSRDHAAGGRLQEIPGMVPSLSRQLGFCAFAPRCPRADDRSRSERPLLQEVRPGHLVACFHPEGSGGGDR